MVEVINRILATIKSKIYMMIGHAVVLAVSNKETIDGVEKIFPLQKLEVECLAGDRFTNIERVQEYGLETYPAVDNTDKNTDGYPEAVAVFINGNRDQGIVIKVGDRRYRINNLQEGEVALYTKWNGDPTGTDMGDHEIRMKEEKEIAMKAANVTITCTEDVTINCANANINCSEDTNIDCVNAAINCSKNADIDCVTANITATTNINLDGGSGAGDLTGIVNGASLCAFTGVAHQDFSLNVFCTKGNPV